MATKIYTLLAFIALLSVASALRMGFAYGSPRDDVSFTYTVEMARQQIEKDYPDVFTEWTIIPVPASQTCPQTCLDAARAFAARGFDVVVMAGQAFFDVDHILADEFPNTKFLQSTRANLVAHPNVSWYAAFIEQVRFLSGVTAGLMTQTNEIGYVTVNRLQPVLRQFNAFYFGVKKVNPNAKIYLISGNAFGNATADRIAAEYILEISNVDVFSFQSLFAEVSRVACERGLLSTGYGSDIRKFVGDSVLTSAMWNWVPGYHYFLDKIIAGQWDNTYYDGTITTGSIDIAEFSPVVTQSVRDIVNNYKQQVIDGTEKMFCGPQANYLSDGAVPVDGCMSRAQQTLVNKVPSSQLDPNFFDLGNVDLSRPATTPSEECWTPPVIPQIPDKLCVRSVSVSQSRTNSYQSGGVTYTQWAVAVKSTQPLFASLRFTLTPASGSIQNIWGATSKGNNEYELDDWRFNGGVRVPAGETVAFNYIVSSDSPAAVNVINSTCAGSCAISAKLNAGDSWQSGITFNQLYNFDFTNTGVTVSDSVGITLQLNGGSITTSWNLSPSGPNHYTASTYSLQGGMTNNGAAGFIVSYPSATSAPAPSFTLDAFVCK